MGKLIINKRVLFVVFIAVIFMYMGILVWNEDRSLSVVTISLSSFVVLGYLFMFPYSYRIDQKSITVYYGFGLKTKATWAEIRYVEDHYTKDTFWLREYHIRYFKTRFRMWEEACIPKNKKTKALIEKCYKGKIDRWP